MSVNRNLKNRTAISTAIETERYKWLQEYSRETSIPISKLFDKAIDELRKSIEIRR